MLVMNSQKSIILMSGLGVELVVIHIIVANFLLNNSALMMLNFACVLMDVERTLNVKRLDVHSLAVRSVFRKVVVHIFDANFVDKHFPHCCCCW